LALYRARVLVPHRRRLTLCDKQKAPHVTSGWRKGCRGEWWPAERCIYLAGLLLRDSLWRRVEPGAAVWTARGPVQRQHVEYLLALRPLLLRYNQSALAHAFER